MFVPPSSNAFDQGAAGYFSELHKSLHSSNDSTLMQYGRKISKESCPSAVQHVPELLTMPSSSSGLKSTAKASEAPPTTPTHWPDHTKQFASLEAEMLKISEMLPEVMQGVACVSMAFRSSQEIVQETQRNTASILQTLEHDKDRNSTAIVSQSLENDATRLGDSINSTLQEILGRLADVETAITVRMHSFSADTGATRSHVPVEVAAAATEHQMVAHFQEAQRKALEELLQKLQQHDAEHPSPRRSPRFLSEQKECMPTISPCEDCTVAIDVDSVKETEAAEDSQEEKNPAREAAENMSENTSVESRAAPRKSGTASEHALQLLEERLNGNGTCLQKFVGGNRFETFMLVAISLQAILLGIEIHLDTTREDDRLSGRSPPPELAFLDYATLLFVIFFAIELLFRLIVLRKRFFFPHDADKQGWNIFDLILVGCSLFELVPDSDFFDTSLIRMIRLLRVVRVLRVARFVPELRKMVFALSHCMSALFWLCAVLCLLLYMFALVFMQGAATELKDMKQLPLQQPGYSSGRVLRASSSGSIPCQTHTYCHFVGLGTAMSALFRVVTGGDEWDDVLSPVMDTHYMFATIGVFFVVFFVFGFMNVATGLFVDRAMQIAKANKETMIEESRKQEVKDTAVLRELFNYADINGDGTLTAQELCILVSNKEVHDFLVSIGVDLSGDIDAVLVALDPDGTGVVYSDDFINVIGRLRGSARSLETTLCLLEVRSMARHVRHVRKQQEKHIALAHGSQSSGKVVTWRTHGSNHAMLSSVAKSHNMRVMEQ